ncbi:hypothetical protein FH972_025430 [Carpinus fangiana]|uniref:Uncharacterized protein n=1 Tax=Carpinus fangiana TaxID=176857 RepID=A0A5N6L187_9ROSI|nr:hypothetical protein FH972_025430 [Carpinus fangiana]
MTLPEEEDEKGEEAGAGDAPIPYTVEMVPQAGAELRRDTASGASVEEKTQRGLVIRADVNLGGTRKSGTVTGKAARHGSRSRGSRRPVLGLTAQASGGASGRSCCCRQPWAATAPRKGPALEPSRLKQQVTLSPASPRDKPASAGNIKV